MAGDEAAGFWLDEVTFPGARIRLGGEILRIAYHDTGVEVVPGYGGVFEIRTPHCRQGDRLLATLSWAGGTWPGPAAGGWFPDWSTLLVAAFDILGVASWRTRRHRDCFHRRGKARYDIAYAIAAAMVRTAPRGGQARFWAVAADTPSSDPLRALAGPMQAGTPPRHLGVVCCGQPVAMIRSDGPVVTPGRALAFDGLWWAGQCVNDLAAAIWDASGHRHAYVVAGPRR